MTDHFAVLGFPHRPWLDPEAVKDRFHELSATLHPDVPNTGDAAHFTALNSAHTTLSDHATRLRHFLDLEAPARIERNSPPVEMADLFMRQAALEQRFTAWRAKSTAASHALGRALLAGDAATLRRDLENLRLTLEASAAQALAKVQSLDADWESRTAATLEALADLQRQLAYLGKWQAQLRERAFQLSAA